MTLVLAMRIPHELLLINGDDTPCHCWHQGSYHTMDAMELQSTPETSA